MEELPALRAFAFKLVAVARAGSSCQGHPAEAVVIILDGVLNVCWRTPGYYRAIQVTIFRYGKMLAVFSCRYFGKKKRYDEQMFIPARHLVGMYCFTVCLHLGVIFNLSVLIVPVYASTST